MYATADGPAAPMVAWQVDSYGPFEDTAKLNSEVGSPAVGPKDVLVRVRASSVNPIDVLMAGECVADITSLRPLCVRYYSYSLKVRPHL